MTVPERREYGAEGEGSAPPPPPVGISRTRGPSRGPLLQRSGRVRPCQSLTRKRTLDGWLRT